MKLPEGELRATEKEPSVSGVRSKSETGIELFHDSGNFPSLPANGAARFKSVKTRGGASGAPSFRSLRIETESIQDAFPGEVFEPQTEIQALPAFFGT